jgi:hypothetical protein
MAGRANSNETLRIEIALKRPGLRLRSRNDLAQDLAGSAVLRPSGGAPL